ncbi:hypothetical protein [Treponema sp.]|uniref:hypothetical protein n=1 Tax=Treponema sp. TaxID=166 RepID=UPI00298DDFF9|nr:hypothetical protein [Treponema sp.]MCQ2240985.1 hypothetical protein [Treponema sp.]
MSLLYFFSYRVAMIFLLAYIGLFTSLKFKTLKSVMILLASYIISSLVDVWGVFFSGGGLMYMIVTLVNFGLLAGTGQLVAREKGFQTIFTVLCASDFILPGNMTCYIVFNRTNDIFSSILLQVFVQSVILFFMVKFVSKYYKESERDIVGWGSICLVPLLFYMSITFLSVWPMSLIDYPAALPGVIMLFVLMVATFTCGIRMYARKGRKQKQDMSLVFLAEYSDRIKNESAKLNEMSSKIEELSCAMQSVTTEILDLLDNGRYDDIKALVTAIRSDSTVVTSERKCANNSINSIMMEAEDYATRSGVNVSFNLNVPEQLGAIEFEYAVVVERLMIHAIKGCSQFYSKELAVSMYPSGAWMNIEMKIKIAEYDALASDNKEESLEMTKVMNKISENIDYSLGVPELDAFMKKYEVQHSIQFKMGMMISEFNVRIN